MKDKIVLVTGANKGIGFGIVKHLGISGWKVIVGARDGQRAEKAIGELEKAGVDVLGWVNIELKDLENIGRAAKEIGERFPELSLLVNNAGIPGDMSVDSENTEIDIIRETLDVPYKGAAALDQQERRTHSQHHRTFRDQSLLAPVSLCGKQSRTERNDGSYGYRV